MNRLVCVVEGKGEVAAVPNLCARVLRHLDIQGWVVDGNPVRRHRNQMVDEGAPGPGRLCHRDGIARAMAMARARPASAVLILCDADDDCPGAWAQSVGQLLAERGDTGAAVMAVREFEGWLLWSRYGYRIPAPSSRSPEVVRGAKERLQTLVKGYRPTTSQLLLTRQIDIARLRAVSPSFDKFVRTVAALCCGKKAAP